MKLALSLADIYRHFEETRTMKIGDSYHQIISLWSWKTY